MSKYINQYTNYAAYSGDSSNFNYPHAAYLQEEGIGMYDRNPSRFYDFFGTVVDGTTGITITVKAGRFSRTQTIPMTIDGNEAYANYTGETPTNFYNTFNGKPFITIEKFGIETSNATGMQAMFQNCASLTSIDLSNFNTSNVTDMQNMFYGCGSLTSIDLSNFNTSNVTNMAAMFYVCSGLKSIDLSSLDTSNVTNMQHLFGHCDGLQEINLTGLDTSKVKSIEGMFLGCSGLTSIDVSGLNTSAVSGVSEIFEYCTSLTSLDLSNWDTSNFSDTRMLFKGCTNIKTVNLSNWNLDRASVNLYQLFYGSGITSLIMNNTNQGTLQKIQSQLVSDYRATKVTIHRDGYAWAYVNNQWVSTQE